MPRGVDVAATYDLAKMLRNRLIAIKSVQGVLSEDAAADGFCDRFRTVGYA